MRHVSRLHNGVHVLPPQLQYVAAPYGLLRTRADATCASHQPRWLRGRSAILYVDVYRRSGITVFVTHAPGRICRNLGAVSCEKGAPVTGFVLAQGTHQTGCEFAVYW